MAKELLKKMAAMAAALLIALSPAVCTKADAQVRISYEGENSATPLPEMSMRDNLYVLIMEAEAMDTSKLPADVKGEFDYILKVAKNMYANKDTTDQAMLSTYNSLQKAIENVKSASGKAQTENAVPVSVFYGVGAGCVAVIGVLVFLLVRKKKTPAPVSENVEFKKEPAYHAQPSVPVQPAAVPEPEETSPGTTLLESAGETTLLNEEPAGETTLLKPASFGELVRVKTGETIVIDKDHFRIGREKTKVDYCVEDNTNIGRFHAEIISDGPHTYLVDQHSRNFTYLNGERIEPEEQVEIIDGDTITFADEEYTFQQ